MPINYKQQVLDEYARKKDAGALSLNLTQPTRLGLKEECLNVFAEKGSPKVDPVLRQFFGPVETGGNYGQRIKNFDVDKFRPLVNFLKDHTLNSQDKNIALLAWLIGFRSPILGVEDASLFRDSLPLVAKSNDPENVLATDEHKPPIAEPKSLAKASPPQQKLFDKRVIIALITVITVVVIWAFFTKNNQCMYWTGNQYKSIPCNEKAGNAVIIALDTFKVSNLKRITLPDTITESALGRVWYRKIKRDSLEYYTAPGEHPLDNKKRLMPLTSYILEKHVLNK